MKDTKKKGGLRLEEFRCTLGFLNSRGLVGSASGSGLSLLFFLGRGLTALAVLLFSGIDRTGKALRRTHISALQATQRHVSHNLCCCAVFVQRAYCSAGGVGISGKLQKKIRGGRVTPAPPLLPGTLLPCLGSHPTQVRRKPMDRRMKPATGGQQRCLLLCRKGRGGSLCWCGWIEALKFLTVVERFPLGAREN